MLDRKFIGSFDRTCLPLSSCCQNINDLASFHFVPFSLNFLQSWNVLNCVAWEYEDLSFLFSIWEICIHEENILCFKENMFGMNV